jgi:hypothetical protein
MSAITFHSGPAAIPVAGFSSPPDCSSAIVEVMSDNTENGGTPSHMIEAELTRIGLPIAEIQGLVISGLTLEDFLRHLRGLPAGASWSDVFPGTPPGWTPSSPPTERALGPFDYQEPPRGAALFASLDLPVDLEAATRALEAVRGIGIPIYGSGLVLDRQHPHMFIVLPLGAPEEHLFVLADFLREQEGIANAYPERYESRREDLA